MSLQKFFVFVILGSCIALLSCSKAKYTPPTTANAAGNTPLALKTATPTNNELADLAYSSFNAACLNPNTNLYYSTTNKDGIAAIWTQAIYWDMAMDAYNRTK